MTRDEEKLELGNDPYVPHVADAAAQFGHKADDGTSVSSFSTFDKITSTLLKWGVEARGILPVSTEHRTDPRFWSVFFVWLSANLNILSFSAGTLGPLVFELNLRDTSLVIIFFNILGCLPPAYCATFGPKLGLRQMCQARYSFGYWGVIPASLLNMITMMGFMILNCILGGETLSSASINFSSDGVPGSGGMSWDVGIVLVSLISLFVSFCGYRVLHIYERIAFIPVVIVYIIALGVSGKHLVSGTAGGFPPATARQILSFGASVAGFVISYTSLASDFTTYMREDVQSWKVFVSTFMGLYLPVVLIQIYGAAFAAAITSNASWAAAYDAKGLSGFLHQILLPAGDGFSRFLLILLAFSVTANIAPTLYSFSLSAQTALPFQWVMRIPRFVPSVLATAILIPLGIVGSTKFYDTLTNFLGLIGYWSACFAAVIIVEHLVVRRRRFSSYSVEDWDSPERLPRGIVAIASCVIALGVVVPCMDQVWFVGPIAKHTGDIGFEIAFVVTGLCYAGASLLPWGHAAQLRRQQRDR